MSRITNRTITHVEDVATKLNLSSADAWALRKAALTLHRWYERECGDTTASGVSYCIERDETTNRPRMLMVPPSGRSWSYPIRDMEAGAIRKIKSICSANGLNFYVQTDPRGGVLYLSRTDKLEESNYNRGVFLA